MEAAKHSGRSSGAASTGGQSHTPSDAEGDCWDCWKLPLHSQILREGRQAALHQVGGSWHPPGDAVELLGQQESCLCTVEELPSRTFAVLPVVKCTHVTSEKLERDSVRVYSDKVP